MEHVVGQCQLSWGGISSGEGLLELTHIGVFVDALLRCGSIPFVVLTFFDAQGHFPPEGEVILCAMSGVFGHKSEHDSRR